MMRLKIDINLAVIQIMWLFLYMRITLVNQSIWMIIELIVCMFCTIYFVANSKCIKKRALPLVTLFACSYLISSLANRSYNGPYITYTGIIFAWKVIIYFIVPWISIKKRGSKKVAQASWNCLMLYWIPSVVTVLIQGRNVVDNANNTYFIGNKFNVAYLNVIMLSLLFYLLKGKVESYNSNYRVFKLNRKKIEIFFFCIGIIYLDLYMKAYTGLFMVLFVLMLALLSRIVRVRYNHRWNGFLSFINKPLTLLVSVVLSGIVTFVLEMIMNIPLIASYLESIGKTGNMLSRTLIYKNLVDIISEKQWIGYGYNSAVVSQYFGPNAQNGLAQVMIYIGIVGTLLMLIVIFYCGKHGRNNSLSAPLLFAIYAFILSATVEITYGGAFFILLAFYSACGWEENCI